jgi:hypothetical protein
MSHYEATFVRILLLQCFAKIKVSGSRFTVSTAIWREADGGPLFEKKLASVEVLTTYFDGGFFLMPLPKNRIVPKDKIYFRPEFEHCLHCGAKLKRSHTAWKKNISTLQGVIQAWSMAYACSNANCIIRTHTTSLQKRIHSL